MPLPEEVLRLISVEQERLGSIFAPKNHTYLKKLESCAELVTHHDSSGLLGFVFFYCNDRKKEVSYISLIATSSLARGKGIGYSLVSHVLQISKQRGFQCCQLEVDKKNHVAYEFYLRAGFKIVEQRENKFLMSIDTK